MASPLGMPEWWPLTDHYTIILSKLLLIIIILIFLINVINYSNHHQKIPDRGRAKSLIDYTVTVYPYKVSRSLEYLPWDAIIEPFRVNMGNISSAYVNSKTYMFNAVEGSKNVFRNPSSEENSLLVTWIIDGKVTIHSLTISNPFYIGCK